VHLHISSTCSKYINIASDFCRLQITFLSLKQYIVRRIYIAYSFWWVITMVMCEVPLRLILFEQRIFKVFVYRHKLIHLG